MKHMKSAVVCVRQIHAFRKKKTDSLNPTDSYNNHLTSNICIWTAHCNIHKPRDPLTEYFFVLPIRFLIRNDNLSTHKKRLVFEIYGP